jgi:signal transduction histidine kinase/DNA-binding NarL/FixJ family response regulator
VATTAEGFTLNSTVMYFMNTEMHLVTFIITMFEIVMLVFQVIYFLQRPSDKSRLQFLLLLVCLIAYNVCSGLFPDEDFIIPLTVQTILAYLVGFTMSMYVVYYFYKVFDLKHLKFFATYGLILFLFLPFVFLFVVPYLLTGNSRLSAQLTVVVPFCYGLGFIYSTARALKHKFRMAKENGNLIAEPLYEHAIAAYISMVCWALLPVIVFFGDFQVLEHTVTNAGFLMMTIIYVKSAIRQSRREYVKLIRSENELQELTKSLKKKVRERTRKLERVMEAKKTTFINLAHETKTPLTLINNYLAEYIQKHGEDQEMKVIKNNVKRLTNDIVNFFDVESYEKGFSMYNHDRVSNFSSLLNDKVSLFRAAATKKGIRLNSTIDSGIYVKAHPGAVDRIVNNLLENAIKYTDKDGLIETALYINETSATFYVKDTGHGIPTDLKDKVFEPYYKLSVPGRNSDGMGMGLSIVKKIVSDIEGTIDLSSEVGKGTEIRVQIPLATNKEVTVHEGINSEDIDFAYNQILLEESVIVADKPFILIVEDNVEMLNFLRSKFKGRYNVSVSRNGKEALERLSSFSSLDLIISDVMMNDMDGYELSRAVTSSERYEHIPFIFLSAKGAAEERLKGLNMGAVAYIQKPFNIDELMAKVESILITLKRHRTAVVSKAYHAMLNENPTHKAVSTKRCTFTDNCKKYHLTSREVEIIKLLIKGIPYKVISADLLISEKTVSKHISNIFAKVEVNNKVELINKLEAQELLNSSIST